MYIYIYTYVCIYIYIHIHIYIYATLWLKFKKKINVGLISQSVNTNPLPHIWASFVTCLSLFCHVCVSTIVFVIQLQLTNCVLQHVAKRCSESRVCRATNPWYHVHVDEYVPFSKNY